MRIRHVAATLLGAIMAMHGTDAAPLDEHLWKSRLLIVSAPAENGAVAEQRRFYRSASGGMSERQILLIEALGDSVYSRQLRTKLSADGRRFQVFLVGKDGHTALSSDKPLSAEYLFGKVDAMPMRRDEMRRGR
jgi:Domain of unknown function (DUF4174)